jgi:hypothetical protein
MSASLERLPFTCPPAFLFLFLHVYSGKKAVPGPGVDSEAVDGAKSMLVLETSSFTFQLCHLAALGWWLNLPEPWLPCW